MSKFIEQYALRCVVENLYKHSLCDDVTYRFDTRDCCGDYTLIKLPFTFASVETARYELYKYLIANYSK